MKLALESSSEHTAEQVTEKESGHGVVLQPEILGHYKNLPITNSLVTSWIVMAVLITLSIVAYFKIKLIPTSLFQGVLELVIEPIYSLASSMAHDKTKLFFPVIMTFFLYILFGNLLGLFPGFGTITFKGEPLLRSINSDLNMTLGLAMLSAFLTHAFAIYYLGIGGYLQKWFSLNPIFLFVGLLELVGEITKMVSLSLRLFGNIFAGEVVLSTISNLFAFVAPLPFYFLEIIVAIVQASVFMMLTLVFMVLLSEKPHGAH